MITTRIHTLARWGLPAFVAASLLEPSSGKSAEEASAKSSYSTNAVDQEACQRQLNVIYGAIQEYQRRNQNPPRWLSDLTPDFIHDPEILVCPFVKETGNVKKWREHFVAIPVFGDPASSYAYEFCAAPIPNLPGKTIRDYKQRQMEVMGFNVPIVRCLAHRPVLNLAFDGNVYESPPEWEDVFVKSKEDEHFFHGELGVSESDPAWSQKMVTWKIAPRGPQPDARILDLSKQYNALLLHLSQIDHSGQLLATYPEGMQEIDGIRFDVRGLVHLTGQDFPIFFPEKLPRDVAVNRKCARIHFLHGTMFPAPPNSRVASYQVHYDDGRTNEIPILYGRDVKTRWFDPRQKSELDNPKVAWISPLTSVGTAGKSLRLYHTAWTNPNPDREVNSIGFISHMTRSAPFLVAITIE